MRILAAEELTPVIDTLCRQACCVLPEPLVAALKSAAGREAPNSAARAVLEQLAENADLAAATQRPCCQDTGMAVVFLDIGRELHIEGDVYAAVNAGVAAAYTGGHMRASVLGAISRQNTGDNTPAVVHIRFVPGDRLHIRVMPKGFGSENMSRLHMLTPADGHEGILGVIAETVSAAGACACPPLIIGVGIGGTMEAAAILGKRQLLRPLGQAADSPVLAALEREALARVNALGIGPMGLGGHTTALAVHIGEEPTHIAGLPVAVNLCCHAYRHAERML